MAYLIALTINDMTNDRIDTNKWIIDNSDIIDSSNQNNIFIDVEKLYHSTNHSNFLDDYGIYIDFDLSKNTIELLHEVDDNASKNKIDININPNNSITKIILENNYDFDFNEKKYKKSLNVIDNYNILSFDANGILLKSTKGKYDNNKYCFSSPLFCCIALNTGINDNTIFNFVEFINILGKKALGIRVDGTNKKYYDFSQNPPLKFRHNNPLSYGNSKGNPFHIGNELLFEFNGKKLIENLIEKKLKIKNL